MADEEENTAEQAIIDEQRQRYSEAREAPEPYSATGEALALGQGIDQARDATIELNNRVMEMVRANDNVNGQALLIGEAGPAMDAWNALVRDNPAQCPPGPPASLRRKARTGKHSDLPPQAEPRADAQVDARSACSVSDAPAASPPGRYLLADRGPVRLRQFCERGGFHTPGRFPVFSLRGTAIDILRARRPQGD